MTTRYILLRVSTSRFQYRKRYEVTCDLFINGEEYNEGEFQYRKRYEVTCDLAVRSRHGDALRVSIPQAV